MPHHSFSKNLSGSSLKPSFLHYLTLFNIVSFLGKCSTPHILLNNFYSSFRSRVTFLSNPTLVFTTYRNTFRLEFLNACNIPSSFPMTTFTTPIYNDIFNTLFFSIDCKPGKCLSCSYDT